MIEGCGKTVCVRASVHTVCVLGEKENSNYITFVYPPKLWKTKLWITSQFHLEPLRGTPCHATKTRSPPTTKLASRADAVQCLWR